MLPTIKRHIYFLPKEYQNSNNKTKSPAYAMQLQNPDKQLPYKHLETFQYVQQNQEIAPAAVSVYIPVTGTEITGLAAGTYSVRYASKEGFDAGADVVVTVSAGPNANQAAPVGLAVAPSAAIR